MSEPLKKAAKNAQQSYTFVCPVNGISFEGSSKREFRVDRVTFIETEKFKRIGRRLRHTGKLPGKRGKWWEQMLNVPAVAMMCINGDPENERAAALRIVRRELNLLAVSQLGYMKRRHGANPRIAGSRSGGAVSTVFLERGGDGGYFSSSRRVADVDCLRLDRMWENYHRRFAFYGKLLKIVRGDTKGLSSGWRQTLTRVSVLLGQSQSSDDVVNAFLLNMIAFEMLLTQQGDRYSSELPARVDAFLGWIYNQHEKNSAALRKRFREQVKAIYKKRCEYVHDGKADDIEVRDLLFSDDLIYNVLLNVVWHPGLFRSKKDVVSFCRKIEAQELLGNRRRVRPKSFRFHSWQYGKEDYESI